MYKSWFKRNWYWIIIIGAPIIAFLVYLGFKQGIAISFAVLSIIIATFFSSRSLKLAQDSLELTRRTRRPFLNVIGNISCYIYPASIGKIIADISNSGNFPADEILVNCELRCVRDINPTIYPIPIEDYKPYPSIYFPGDHMGYHFESKDQIQAKSGDVLEVYITINYTNKLTKEKYKTVRAYTETFSSRDGWLSLIPYPKGDEWN